MLKKFELRNYKNFKDTIVVDFSKVGGYQFGTDCIHNGTIGKMLIYGRNATGKTNLGVALMNIALTLFTKGRAAEGVFLNADSDEDVAYFAYTFQFGTDEVLYRYHRLSEFTLEKEELYVNGKKIFKCDFLNWDYSFEGMDYVEAETAVIERYLQTTSMDDDVENMNGQQMPFLRWVINNVALKSDSILLKLAEYVKYMRFMTVGNINTYTSKNAYEQFFSVFEDKKQLKKFEDFLNHMGIECKLVSKKLPDGQWELYFKYSRLVPFFENASRGTISLMNFYRNYVIRTKNATFIYLDEFDAFCHYEMSENIIQYFKEEHPNCQVIFTSHNTNLMTNRLMRPDCLFILSTKGQLTALCDATERELREGHNLEKMYISGEFEDYE